MPSPHDEGLILIQVTSRQCRFEFAWPVRTSRSAPWHTAGLAGAGVGLGVVTEYLLDPSRGRTRRARVRDQARRTIRKAGHGAGIVARDFANRSRGLVAGTRYRIQGADMDDQVLQERVRATLRRYVSHSRSIDVSVREGVVTLSGHVLLRAPAAARAVARIPGLTEIQEDWIAHQSSAAIPVSTGQQPKQPRPDLPAAALVAVDARTRRSRSAGSMAGRRAAPGRAPLGTARRHCCAGRPRADQPAVQAAHRSRCRPPSG